MPPLEFWFAPSDILATLRPWPNLQKYPELFHIEKLTWISFLHRYHISFFWKYVRVLWTTLRVYPPKSKMLNIHKNTTVEKNSSFSSLPSREFDVIVWREINFIAKVGNTAKPARLAFRRCWLYAVVWQCQCSFNAGSRKCSPFWCPLICVFFLCQIFSSHSDNILKYFIRICEETLPTRNS